MQPGDHIMIDRGVYVHHGIYVGDGNVVHFRGDAGQKLVGVEEPMILMQPMEEFGPEGKVQVIEYDDDIGVLDPGETVSRALHKVGSTSYNLAHNNCEHFSIWCKTGLHESTQVNEAMDWLADVVSDII